MNSEDDEDIPQDPHEWFKVDRAVRQSRHWNIAARTENVQELDIHVVRSQLNRHKLKNLALYSPTSSMNALFDSP